MDLLSWFCFLIADAVTRWYLNVIIISFATLEASEVTPIYEDTFIDIHLDLKLRDIPSVFLQDDKKLFIIHTLSHADIQ